MNNLGSYGNVLGKGDGEIVRHDDRCVVVKVDNGDAEKDGGGEGGGTPISSLHHEVEDRRGLIVYDSRRRHFSCCAVYSERALTVTSCKEWVEMLVFLSLPIYVCVCVCVCVCV